MTSHGTEPQILSQGGFKLVNGQRKLLRESGIDADVVCPPGVDPNK